MTVFPNSIPAKQGIDGHYMAFVFGFKPFVYPCEGLEERPGMGSDINDPGIIGKRFFPQPAGGNDPAQEPVCPSPVVLGGSIAAGCPGKSIIPAVRGFFGFALGGFRAG
ncbi:hypothetical protein Holit_03351 [Hollandina sp. SP2]